MTAKQLKEVTALATHRNIQFNHTRTGYFVNVVTINGQSYTELEQAIARLKSLRPMQSKQS